jgi:hypothetical protein
MEENSLVVNKKVHIGILVSVIAWGMMLCIPPVIAQSAVVSIQNATANPGETVTVPINITDVDNMGTANVWLSYNKDVVIVESISEGDLSPVTPAINNTAGMTRMNWFSATGKTGNFVFAYVTLKAVGSAGQSSSLDIDVKELGDTSANAISRTVDDGVFDIPSPTPTVVSIQNATANPGETVTVAINITDVDNMGTANVWLSYNKDVVIVESISEGELSPITPAIDNTAGVTRMNWFSATGKTGDFVFAYVTLRAVGSAGQCSSLDLDVKELGDTSANAIPHTVEDGTFMIKLSVFDTGPPANPYPSISGTHYGTITPNQTITVSSLYTYPCAGTGGHTEYAKLWNDTWTGEEAFWDGYQGNWHSIAFDEPFTLFADKEYYYEIRTGSYPQIHHTNALSTAKGWINCSSFVDANGKEYNGWIPAIKLAYK